MILKVSKTILLILIVACALLLPQTSEGKEDLVATVYVASQLRGNIWSTFYSPDSDVSLTAGISAGQKREVIAIGKYSMSDGEPLAVSKEQAQINAIRFYTDKTTLIADVNHAFAVGDNVPITSFNITEVATQGRDVDMHEREKQDPVTQYLLSVSIRATFSGHDVIGDVAPEKFREYDVAANFRLPLGWYSQSGWGVGTRLMVSGGALHGGGETGIVASFIPLVALGSKDGRFTLDLGAGGALLSREHFGTQDYGGLFQFALTVGAGVPLYKRLGVGYRLMHYSDASIYGNSSSGADLHMIELIYRF